MGDYAGVGKGAKVDGGVSLSPFVCPDGELARRDDQTPGKRWSLTELTEATEFSIRIPTRGIQIGLTSCWHGS